MECRGPAWGWEQGSWEPGDPRPEVGTVTQARLHCLPWGLGTVILALSGQFTDCTGHVDRPSQIPPASLCPTSATAPSLTVHQSAWGRTASSAALGHKPGPAPPTSPASPGSPGSCPQGRPLHASWPQSSLCRVPATILGYWALSVFLLSPQIHRVRGAQVLWQALQARAGGSRRWAEGGPRISLLHTATGAGPSPRCSQSAEQVLTGCCAGSHRGPGVRGPQPLGLGVRGASQLGLILPEEAPAPSVLGSGTGQVRSLGGEQAGRRWQWSHRPARTHSVVMVPVDPRGDTAR